MNFYITSEPISKIKRSFLNLKMFSIIDVNAIIEECGYTNSIIDQYSIFIINKKISDLIKLYSKSRRTRGIIYINTNLNEDVIAHIYELLTDIQTINNVILLDDYNIPKMKYLYYMFEEILFFPSIKKIKLIECKSLEKYIKWKI